MAYRNYATIHNAIVKLFDGLKLSDGSTLTASNTIYDKDALGRSRLPLLLIRDDQINASDDLGAFEVDEDVTLPAYLYVSETGDGKGYGRLRAFKTDLQVQCIKLGALPTIDGKVIKDVRLYKQSDLDNLINAKPLRISRYQISQKPEDGRAFARLTLTFSYQDNLDPYEYSPLKAFEVLFADKVMVDDITAKPIQGDNLLGAHFGKIVDSVEEE